MDADRRPNLLQRFKIFLLTRSLAFFLTCSIIASIAFGLIIRSSTAPFSDRHAMYLALPGDVLIRLLKCSATPLIIACIIVALGSLDIAVSRRICWHLIFFMFISLCLSASIAISSVIMIHPGRPEEDNLSSKDYKGERVTVMDIFLDMFRNIITSNMIGMYIYQYKTELTPPKENQTENDTMKWKVGGANINSMNLLGMILVAVLCGLSLAILQNQGKGLYSIAENIYEVSMKLATWVLWSSPVLMFVLIMSEILKVQDFGKFLATWGLFVLTVYTGYIIIFLLEYPLLVLLLTGQNPFKLYKNISSALMTAYATSSSMATMPVVLDCLLKHELEPRLVRFLVPIGLNVHKAGATNFLVCATVFIAQMLDISLTVGHYITIMILATMGSIAAAAVPYSSIVVLVMILNGLGMKQHLVAGLLAVEWINDRGATLINVLGNCSLTKIIAVWNDKFMREAQINFEERQ